jgi:hypothetical protein
MGNLRYLLVAIAALTLIMSVVSGVNPNYFAGLNAFADEHEEDEEDDDNSGSGSDDESEEEEDDEEDDDDKGKGKEKDDEELEQSLGDNTKVTLEADDEHVNLEVEIENGDLDDGSYDVMFACASPDVD